MSEGALVKEGKRLFDLGFAIHWLKPRSKVPVETGWSTSKRKSWVALAGLYQEGMNLGVRLGEPSHLGGAGGYLAVIDCDVKSSDPRHLREMTGRLRELQIDFTKTPQVLSGRGNGSMHLYVRTREPLTPMRFSQSNEKVRVQMKVKPSNSDLTNLSKEEIAQGLRLRAAWEISIMGSGQQVVLPPSIHPDTGALYVWGKPLVGLEDLPWFTPPHKKSAGEKVEGLKGFTPVEVSLDDLMERLPPKVANMILSGEGCEDRSAALFSVSMSMLRSGFTRQEILSVLTDRSFYLGETAYDHAQTESVSRAANWLYKFTVAKAERESSAARDFEDNAVIESTATPEELAAQAQELIEMTDWSERLERGGAGNLPKPTLKNVKLILTHGVGEGEEARAPLFARNEFAGVDTYARSTPWGGRKGAEITDLDIIRIKVWLGEKFRMEPNSDRIEEAVQFLASQNSHHPVREYLGALKWDGVPRIDFWMRDYMGAVGPEPYLSDVSRKFLISMVARVMNPGAKVDHVVIWEGKQGCGKSTAASILGGEWFSDARIDVGDKDAVVTLKSVWLLELGELSSLNRADLNTLKSFVTQQVDRIRLPYGRRAENFPRQCVFIGTTNNDDYLRDRTGNRRYWPVHVTGCKFEELAAVRDQLLAEAVAEYDLGEPMHLIDPRSLKQAEAEQEARVSHDLWVEKIDEFLKSKPEGFNTKKFTMRDLCFPGGPVPLGAENRRDQQMRIGECLRVLGFVRTRAREHGVPKWFWVDPREPTCVPPCDT